jgi:hypothetical protein
VTDAIVVSLLVAESTGLPAMVLLASGVPCMSATVSVKLRLEPLATVQFAMGDPLHAGPLACISTIWPGTASSVIEKLLAPPCATVKMLCCWESRFPVALARRMP